MLSGWPLAALALSAWVSGIGTASASSTSATTTTLTTTTEKREYAFVKMTGSVVFSAPIRKDMAETATAAAIIAVFDLSADTMEIVTVVESRRLRRLADLWTVVYNAVVTPEGAVALAKTVAKLREGDYTYFRGRLIDELVEEGGNRATLKAELDMRSIPDPTMSDVDGLEVEVCGDNFCPGGMQPTAHAPKQVCSEALNCSQATLLCCAPLAPAPECAQGESVGQVSSSTLVFVLGGICAAMCLLVCMVAFLRRHKATKDSGEEAEDAEAPFEEEAVVPCEDEEVAPEDIGFAEPEIDLMELAGLPGLPLDDDEVISVMSDGQMSECSQASQFSGVSDIFGQMQPRWDGLGSKTEFRKIGQAKIVHVISTPFSEKNPPAGRKAEEVKSQYDDVLTETHTFNPNTGLRALSRAVGMTEKEQGDRWLELWTSVAMRTQRTGGECLVMVRNTGPGEDDFEVEGKAQRGEINIAVMAGIPIKYFKYEGLPREESAPRPGECGGGTAAASSPRSRRSFQV